MRKKGKLQLLNSLCISEERLILSPSPYPSVCNVPLGKVEVKEVNEAEEDDVQSGHQWGGRITN